MKKILVIRLSSIGDIVLTSPVVRCLKTQFPDTEIHYITKKENFSILTANPHITKLWLFNKNFDELIPELRKENFDHIVDLHRNFRSAYLIKRLNRPASSFPKSNIRKWMMVRLRMRKLKVEHVVERYFNAVSQLGVKYDGNGLDYFIPAEEEVGLTALPDQFLHGYTAVVIGGKHTTKILPEEKIISICNHLNMPVILLGGPEDRSRGERIALQSNRTVLNACGIYSINQSASLVRQAINVITNDTGLMHIAAAFRRPIVSVWGNTVPGFGMYPFYPDSLRPGSLFSEVKGLSCRPCSKIGYDKCPQGHFRCMMDQDTDRIVNFINGRH